jgi:hypothetical protein
VPDIINDDFSSDITMQRRIEQNTGDGANTPTPGQTRPKGSGDGATTPTPGQTRPKGSQESPAIPVMTSPSPNGKLQTFHYKKTEKKFGRSPAGKNVLPIERSGRSHGHIKNVSTGKIISSHSVFKPQNSIPFSERKEALFALLRNLKMRVDTDLGFQQENSMLSPTHHTAAIKQIIQCKNELRGLYTIAKNKSKLLQEINEKITASWIYNPFLMGSMYIDSFKFDISRAFDEAPHLQHITDENLSSPPDEAHAPETLTFSPGASSSDKPCSAPKRRKKNTQEIAKNITAINDCSITMAVALSPSERGYVGSWSGLVFNRSSEPGLYDDLPPPRETPSQTFG